MQLKKIAVAVLCLASIATISTSQAAQPAGKVMAVVNNVAIPQSELDVLKQDRAAQGQPVNDQVVNGMRDSLIDGTLLEQQAIKQGLDKDPTIQTRLTLAKTQLLANAYIASWIKANPVSENDVLTEYNKLKSTMGTKQYEVEHILVPTEAEAKSIIAQLNKKANFEELAKKDSKDASAAQGGQLGWVSPANLVKEFADAMVQLKKGEYSKEPVHTQYGWHVIRVVDIRPFTFPAYDQVKDRIRTGLEQQKVAKMVSELRASAKIQ